MGIIPIRPPSEGQAAETDTTSPKTLAASLDGEPAKLPESCSKMGCPKLQAVTAHGHLASHESLSRRLHGRAVLPTETLFRRVAEAFAKHGLIETAAKTSFMLIGITEVTGRLLPALPKAICFTLAKTGFSA